MTTYLVLEFNDDEQAKTFTQDVLYGSVASSTQVIETYDSAKIIGAYKKPTVYCQCVGKGASIKRRGYSRGKLFGWWVCDMCGSPSKLWAQRDCWHSIGINLIPAELLDTEFKQAQQNWKSKYQWDFLLEGMK